jgi:hypothetical protein
MTYLISWLIISILGAIVGGIYIGFRSKKLTLFDVISIFVVLLGIPFIIPILILIGVMFLIPENSLDKIIIYEKRRQ